MMRRRFLILGAVLTGVALAGLAPPARADFEVRYSTDGGSTFTTVGTSNSNPAGVNGSVGALSFTTSFSFTSVNLSALELSVSGLVTGSVNLIIEASVKDIPTAPPPQALSWSFTSSSSLGGLTQTSQEWVDQSDQLYGGATGGPGGTSIVATTGSLTAPSTGSLLFTASPTYSWTTQYKLTGTTTAGGGVLPQGISADNNSMITTPVPSGLLLGFTGLPSLGLGAWLRRRRTRTPA